jgi:hypothetical protein
VQVPALQYCPLAPPQTVPSVIGLQVPLEPPVLLAKHEWQAVPQAVLQQTPSTQVFPLGHWLEVVQLAPFPSLGVQVPDAQ